MMAKHTTPLMAMGCTMSLLLAPAVIAAQGTSSAPPVDRAAALRSIDSLVTASIAAWDMPGIAVSIVHRDSVLLSRGYGVRDPRSGAPVTRDTYFPIASLAKAFTAVGVGMLVDDGRLGFDGAVRRYIPGFELHDPIATHEVTLRDLLSHRSGMQRRDSFIYYKVPGFTPQELLARLPHLDLGSRPRERYHYSNAAYVVVGLAMEHASGMSYEQFMQQRVFDPLGMRRTTFSTPVATADRNHAVGRWYWRGEPVYEYYDYGRIINAHGGISSTADDMARWMMLNLNAGAFDGRQLIRRQTLQETHRTQIPADLGGGEATIPMGYAMGWNTYVYRGEPLLSHNGGVNGIRTVTALLPQQRLGVTLLGNEATDLPDLLALEILDRLIGATSRDRLGPALAAKQRRDAQRSADAGGSRSDTGTVAPPSHPLADYVGLYTHPGFGEIRVALREGALTATYNGHTAPLRHVHYDVFRGAPEGPDDVVIFSVQFLGDLDGRIAHLTFGVYGDARFERQPDERLSDPAQLAGLAGTYDLGEARITITVAGRALVYQRDDLEPATLVPGLDGHYHHPRAPGLRFTFVRDASGRAVTMVRKDGSQTIELPRIR